VNAEPLRILVVDDEAPIAAAIAAVLRRRGHDVRIAASAEAALELGAPDVLISELALPHISGLELLSRLHERGARPHTVFVSARPTVDDCRRALLMGASEYLVKPFRLEELVRAVEAAPAAPPAAPTRASDALDRVYAASPECVDRIARDVAAHVLAAGVGPACRARIASACCEIVDNARRHGYAHGRGRIHVTLDAGDGRIIVRIRDDGLGFEPSIVEDRCFANGRSSAEKSGLARATSLTEDMIVVTAPGKGTEVTLRFDARRADLGDEGTIDLTERDWFTPDLARRVLHTVKKYDTADLFQLSPALAVVVGRLLAGPDPARVADLSARR